MAAKKYLSLLLLGYLVCLSLNAYGQEKWRYGMAHVQGLEEMLNGRRWQGISLHTKRSWVVWQSDSASDKGSVLYVSVFGQLGAQQNVDGFWGIRLDQAFFANYQWRINHRHSTGPKLINGSFSNYYLGLDDGHLYWTKQCFLGWEHQWGIAIAQQPVDLAFSLYAIGWYSRPVEQNFESNWRIRRYYHYMNQNLKAGSLADVFHGRVEISVPLKPKTALAFQCRYLQTNIAQRSLQLFNTLSYVRHF